MMAKLLVLTHQCCIEVDVICADLTFLVQVSLHKAYFNGYDGQTPSADSSVLYLSPQVNTWVKRYLIWRLNLLSTKYVKLTHKDMHKVEIIK